MLKHSTRFNPMNKLTLERRVAVVKALAEGTSIRGTVRLTGAAKDTVTKLLVELGTAVAAYQRDKLVNLSCARVQCDEIWAFVGAKEKNVEPALRGQGRGDVWTWTAMCADSKLIFSWYVGRRDSEAAHAFMQDVAGRVVNRLHLTTDGLPVYAAAVEKAFGWNGIDYSMLVKVFGGTNEKEGARRYSPAKFIRAEKEVIMGNPDQTDVSTSYVERANLTMRMGMRRFTRLTNAFSKKIENHGHSIALHMMYYNFCRSHMTLAKANGGIHTTPAYRAFLERLVSARQKARYTQGEVAKALRMPQSRLSRMESGERRIDVIELDELARFYGKPLSYFIPRRK